MVFLEFSNNFRGPFAIFSTNISDKARKWFAWLQALEVMVSKGYFIVHRFRMERHHVSLMVVMFLVVLCVSQCIAQVNFSPNWGGGKRSADPPDECRSSMDSLKYIYKLIQVNNR